MAKALTLAAIRDFRPGGKRREIRDGLISGLYFVLQPSGAASWALRYRYGGKNRKLTLGPYPAISLPTARELARKAIGAIAQGRDPAADKQAARMGNDHQDVIENVVASFVERHVKATMRSPWARKTERCLEKEIVARWRGRRLSAISKADVHAVLDKVVDSGRPIQANRCFAILRKMCNWAVERGLIERSPCERIRKPSVERSRDRVLSDDELQALWAAAEALGWPYGPFIQLLTLTGQRRDEVASMCWSEIDLPGRLWKIPKERCKNGIAHHVPLSLQALSVFETLPRVGDSLVFTTNGATGITGGFSRAKRRLNALLPEGMPPFVLHDLRRTLATGMARLGVNLPVIEKVLNHVSGSFRGIVGVYQRHEFEPEKRAALEAWGRHVEAIISGSTAGNVISLKR